MESRLALAMALSLGILVGFQLLFPQQKSETTQSADAPASAVESPTADLGRPAAVGSADPIVTDPGAIIEVQTPLFRARFASRGGRLVGFELAEYRKDATAGSGPYDLVRANGSAPLALLWRTETGAVVDDRSVLYEVTASAEQARPGQPAVVTMRGRTSSGATITKTLRIEADSYFLDYKVSVEGLAATPLAVGWARQLDPNKAQADVEGAVGYFDAELHSFDAASLEETEIVEGQAAWAGYAEHYFLAAYVPRTREPLKLVASSADGSGQSALWTNSATTSLDYGLYIGPKSFSELEKADPYLVEAVDLGWFWFVAKPLLLMLRMIESAVGNYGWAIVLLTVAVRAAFYPVNKKQIEAMKGMQRIQPEVKKVQERYADDREKMNAEMMELYRRHKVNPLAGCLPMLIQLPVFIGLYNVLLQSIELRHAPFFGWMHDLSQPDRLGSLAIPFVEPAGIPVMTLLMGASMILQQKMTPSTADPAQQRIMMIMPVVFTVMFVNFPAGLVLYWLSNNVLSIAQQWYSDRTSK
ncbi:MAG: membrane protein insertase YidC [Candidatus Binatia bacterium]